MRVCSKVRYQDEFSVQICNLLKRNQSLGAIARLDTRSTGWYKSVFYVLHYFSDRKRLVATGVSNSKLFTGKLFFVTYVGTPFHGSNVPSKV